MKTWAQKTIERITDGTITESQLRHVRSRIKRAYNGQGDISLDDAQEIIDTVEAVKPAVSRDQADKGAEYLRALAFKKDGTQRATRDAEELTAHDLRVIRSLQGFRLVGFEFPECGRYFQACHPIYRALGESGSFDYVAPSWQSGYRFAVVGRIYA